MKKVFAFAAVALMAMTASALELPNQPVGQDGFYVVKWDCAQGKFAAANDFESDEMVTIAFDVTGTPLADWLTQTPTAPGASRGIASNLWTGCGPLNSDVRRLKQIQGNIWGMTIAFTQAAAEGEDYTKAVTIGEVLGVAGQLFGFEYTADNPGAGWWMWPAGWTEGESIAIPGQENIFITAQYTGKKTSPEFYGSDGSEEMYGFDLKGYAAPCSMEEPSALEHVKAVKGLTKFIENGNLYFKAANGQIVNALGATVLR